MPSTLGTGAIGTQTVFVQGSSGHICYLFLETTLKTIPRGSKELIYFFWGGASVCYHLITALVSAHWNHLHTQSLCLCLDCIYGTEPWHTLAINACVHLSQGYCGHSPGQQKRKCKRYLILSWKKTVQTILPTYTHLTQDKGVHSSEGYSAILFASAEIQPTMQV